jgi:predicted amidohydrolase
VSGFLARRCSCYVIFKGEMEIRGKRKSSVRVGALSMVIDRRQKEGLFFYDELLELCERFLPVCLCDIVLLPECYCVREEEEQSLDGPLAKTFGDLARSYNLYLIAPFREKCAQDIFNTMAVLSPHGEVIFFHRKVHLAPNDDGCVRAGDVFQVFDLPWFRAGIVTCYDNMFPESTRSLALQGARVVFFPSFGMQKTPHRNVARCQDNHIYLVSTGVIDMSCSQPAEFFATGSVIAPSGEAVAEASVEQRMMVVELPLDPKTGRLLFSVEENLLIRRRPQAYTALCP